jgi:hypothetical protein
VAHILDAETESRRGDNARRRRLDMPVG